MTLIQSAKINGLDPQAYLRDVLERLPRVVSIFAYSSEACHAFHVKAATQTGAKLPPVGA